VRMSEFFLVSESWVFRFDENPSVVKFETD